MATIRKGNSLKQYSGTLPKKKSWMMWMEFRSKACVYRGISTSSSQLKQPSESTAFYRLPAKSPWVWREPHTLGLFAATDAIWDGFISKWGDFSIF